MTLLKECCSLLTDGDWIESKDQSESGIRLIQTGNIGNGEFLEKEGRAKYISEETFRRLGCTEIFPGDILISRLPEPVGRACLIPDKAERMITAVDCSILRIDESVINKKFFLFFLKSSKYYNQLTGKLAGTTRVRISRKNLEKVSLTIPSMAEQNRIANVLGQLDRIIKARKAQLSALDELVKARFVEMFGDCSVNSKKFVSHKGVDLFKFSSGKFLPEEKRLKEGIPVYGGNGIAWYTDSPLIDFPTIVIGRVGALCGNIHIV